MRVAPALTALALLGTAVGCGGGGAGSGSGKGGGSASGGAGRSGGVSAARSAAEAAAGAIDPCASLTPQQIKAALGGGVGTGLASGDTTRPACDWAVTGSALLGDGSLEVRDEMMDAEEFALSKAGLVSSAPHGAVAVAGLGTDAFYSADVDAVTVLKGTTTFTVQATGSNPMQDAAKVKSSVLALAAQVAKS